MIKELLRLIDERIRAFTARRKYLKKIASVEEEIETINFERLSF